MRSTIFLLQCFFVALILTGATSNAEGLSELEAHLEAAVAIDADVIKSKVFAPNATEFSFTQAKHVPGLTRPLKSSGTLTLDVESGVIFWTIVQPFARAIEIGPDGFLTKKADGSTEQKGSQAYKQVSSVLRNILRRDFSALSDVFALKLYDSDGLTNIFLEPKNGYLKELIPWIAFSATGPDSFTVTIRESGNIYSTITMTVDQVM